METYSNDLRKKLREGERDGRIAIAKGRVKRDLNSIEISKFYGNIENIVS